MAWWQVTCAQAGAISAAQLRAQGRLPNAVCRMADSGELVRLSRGIYLAGATPLTFRARLWAAVLATDGTLVRSSAARLWGVLDQDRSPASDDDGLVHVSVEHRRTPAAPDWVQVHRGRFPADERRTRAGLPVSSRGWTVLDLLATASWPDATRLADRAVQRGWIAATDPATRVARHPGLYGNGQLRRLALQLGDGAAARSERVLHSLLRRAGVDGWVANHPVWSQGELVAVVDVALPALRLAIEVDGMAYHVDVDRFRRDRSRQNALVALGWTVLRFTWADLTERPGYVVATVRRFAA